MILAGTRAGTDSRSGRRANRGAGQLRPADTRPMQMRGWTRRSTLAATEHSPSVTFDEGMTLDCGARLSRMTVAYRTYGTLNAARSNAVLVCHALTGDQYVAETHPGHRQGGLVGHGGGPRPANRHRPLLRHLRQCAGRLHGLDRPAQPARRRRRSVGHRLPAGHHPRHGARAEDADRPPRHRAAVRGARRLDGRHAGAAMGGELPRRRVRRPADRRCGLSLGAEHRVPRGGAAGDLRRSGLAGRPLLDERADSGARAWRWRACARTSPICRRRR